METNDEKTVKMRDLRQAIRFVIDNTPDQGAKGLMRGVFLSMERVPHYQRVTEEFLMGRVTTPDQRHALQLAWDVALGFEEANL